MSEQELAAAVVAWGGARGWTVLQEVEISRGGRRCDVVAVRRRSQIWASSARRRSASRARAGARLAAPRPRVSAATAARAASSPRVAAVTASAGGGRQAPPRARAGSKPAERTRVSERLRRQLARSSERRAGPQRALRSLRRVEGDRARGAGLGGGNPGGSFADMVSQVRHPLPHRGDGALVCAVTSATGWCRRPDRARGAPAPHRAGAAAVSVTGRTDLDQRLACSGSTASRRRSPPARCRSDLVASAPHSRRCRRCNP